MYLLKPRTKPKEQYGHFTLSSNPININPSPIPDELCPFPLFSSSFPSNFLFRNLDLGFSTTRKENYLQANVVSKIEEALHLLDLFSQTSLSLSRIHFPYAINSLLDLGIGVVDLFRFEFWSV